METVNEIIEIDGRKVVMINKLFHIPRKGFSWKSVEVELKKYVGRKFIIATSNEIISVSAEFPDEFAHSNDTYNTRGPLKKVKAKICVGIEEIVFVAIGKEKLKDYGNKHGKKAKAGWQRYKTNFALPVYDDNGTVVRFNLYSASVIIRCSSNNNLYLYDIVRIKKRGVWPALDDGVKR